MSELRIDDGCHMSEEEGVNNTEAAASGSGEGFALEPVAARERPAGAVAPNEFARLVGYTGQMVLRYIHDYGMPHVKVGGRYWIDREQGLAWFNARKATIMDPMAGGPRRRRGRPSIAESSASAKWRRSGGGSGEVGGEGEAVVPGGLPIGGGGGDRGSGGCVGGGTAVGVAVDVAGGGVLNGELYRAKVARELAAAKKLELENAASLGVLLPRADVEAAWGGVLATFRSGLDALPERAVGDIMVEVEAWLTSGAVDDLESLRERLSEKLTELAQEVRGELRESVLAGASASGSGERSAA